jgi:hypothetical protein
MPVQMIELEEVTMIELIDDALEREIFEGGKLSCWSGSNC